MRYSRGTRRKQKIFIGKRKGGRNRKNIFSSKIIPVGVVIFIVWVLWKQVASLFSGGFLENSIGEIQILRGRAEFQLEGSEDWTRAYSEQKFLPGDSLKTIGNARVSLEFLGGNVFFLGPNTHIRIKKLEERSSGEKKGIIVLEKGRIWSYIPEEKLLEEGESSIIIESSRQEIVLKGSIFDITSNESEDVIRLIRGNIESSVVVDSESKKIENISVGVGQKFVLNSQNSKSIKKGENVLEITDNEFLESDWHLENLEQFAPEEAAQIRRKIEISAPRKAESDDQNADIEISDEIEPPKIITPENNTSISAGQDLVKIEGSASLETFQIAVNGYTLTKFQPGDRKWTYFASKKFGTLVAGENKYSIVAISRDGKKSKPAEVVVTYEGESTPEVLPDTVAAESIDESFSPPVVTSPVLADPSQPYETSTEVVTILGTVPVGTIRVTVNDFVLKKFVSGHTKFSYIANANYGNMKKGENTFVINAYGPNGKVSTTSLKIFYTPISL